MSGSSTHVCDSSHWQARIVTFLSTVGPALVLGENDGDSEGSKEPFIEGCCEGCTDNEGGFDSCRDGGGDLVGESE